MRIVTIDAETFWSQTHTLSKMSPMAYCMHPETEIISMAIKHDHHPTDVWFGEEEIQRVVSKLDWSDCLVIGHNLSGFDAMILSWRLGIKPRMWGCTLAMARPIHTVDVGNSLAKLVEHYKLGVKDNSALVNTRGRHLKDFTDAERAAMKVYNRADVDQCYELFKILRKHYSVAELMQIDATIRMLIEPQFLLDKPLLEDALVKERDRKHATVMELAELLDLDIQGDTSEVAEQVTARLASSAKFSEILSTRGVETPMKPSPTNPLKQVPALAKTDQAFIDLQEHEDPIVSAAASARLAIKSTILETRIEAFLEAGEYCGGYLPVPLNYCGAATTGRWSGWGGANLQNLNRINPDKPKLSDALRNSLRAGHGKKVIVADLSGIELRVNMFLWKVPYAMELFEANPAKADLYKYFAANSLYHVPEDQISKQQRQIGKVCLVEGTEVLTRRGLVPIEQVVSSDQVWDGIEWVDTLGAVFNGVRDVITWDGVTATPDHEVWVEDGRKVSLGAARSQLLRLARTGAGRTPLGFRGADEPGVREEKGASVRQRQMHGVRCAEADELRQSSVWSVEGVPELQSEMRSPGVAAPEAGCGEASVPREDEPFVPQVRGSGRGVSIPLNGRGSGVGDEQPRAESGRGVGPDRQQRPLRAGEPSVVDAPAEHGKPFREPSDSLPRVSDEVPGGPVCGQHAEGAAQDADGRGDTVALETAVVQTQGRVWDLLNCGPRHRFTANGRLVSNCHLGLGFGAGAATFVGVAKIMGGVNMDLSEATDIVSAYRQAHSEITEGWRTCHRRLQDIHDGREMNIDPWGHCVTHPEGIKLPSGRLIRYPGLHVEVDSKGKDEWWYGTGRHRARIYAGKVTENCLAEGTLVLTDSGWKPIEKITLDDLVHDGVCFVQHRGLSRKGEQECMKLHGVWLTPDHQVLDAGSNWVPANEVGQLYSSPMAQAHVHGRTPVDQGSGTRREVFDILNAGPLTRFVILGNEGPMVVHNCVQALARDVIADNSLDFFRRTGLRPALMVHDELVYVVPEDRAEDYLNTLQRIMQTRPKWWPELVTWSEGSVGDTYGEAK